MASGVAERLLAKQRDPLVLASMAVPGIPGLLWRAISRGQKERCSLEIQIDPPFD
jgi:hypothetical protein